VGKVGVGEWKAVGVYKRLLVILFLYHQQPRDFRNCDRPVLFHPRGATWRAEAISWRRRHSVVLMDFHVALKRVSPATCLEEIGIFGAKA
jgi:hypothetical protein